MFSASRNLRKARHAKIRTHQYYDRLHPSVFLVLYHIDLEQRPTPFSTSCDWECPEELQILIPSSSHHPQNRQALAPNVFSVSEERKRLVKSIHLNRILSTLTLVTWWTTFTKCAMGSPHLSLSFSILSSSGSSLPIKNEVRTKINDMKQLENFRFQALT